jgi:hypothetical protein
MPFKICWNVFCFFICLPMNLCWEFCDAFISQALNQLSLTKGDAGKIAKRVARKQFVIMKHLCVYLTIFLIISSISFGFSTSMYAGLYWVMIPTGIIQEQPIYFSYKPIDNQQKQVIKQEAKEGKSVFAHILNDKPLPNIKMVTSLDFEDCNSMSPTKDITYLVSEVLGYIGLANQTVSKDLTVNLCKNDYNIDLVVQFYKKDDVEQIPISDKGFDYTIFTNSRIDSTNKNNEIKKSTAVNNLEKEGMLSSLINNGLVNYFIPFKTYLLPQTKYDEVSINLFENLDNEQF